MLRASLVVIARSPSIVIDAVQLMMRVILNRNIGCANLPNWYPWDYRIWISMLDLQTWIFMVNWLSIASALRLLNSNVDVDFLIFKYADIECLGTLLKRWLSKLNLGVGYWGTRSQKGGGVLSYVCAKLSCARSNFNCGGFWDRWLRI